MEAFEPISDYLKNCPKIKFKTSEIVIDIDEAISGLPFVTKGLLKVYKEDDNDNELFLYYLKPGDVCSMGIKCCITEGKSVARVYAEEDSEVVFVSKELLLNLQTSPVWNNYIIQSLADRIDSLLGVADDLAFKKLDQRILDYLKKKEELAAENNIKITHREISNDLNSSREVISRVLKKLEKEGILEQNRNEIRLLE